MTVSYEQVAEHFEKLRSFLLDDLNLVLASPTGGNYAAVLLIMSACDAIGRLRYGTRAGGEPFFSQYLLPPSWRPVGVHLFDALRNGLAHSYDTKSLVQVGDRVIEVVISRREKAHLSFEAADSRLFVNVDDLAAQLNAAFVRFDRELHESAALRDKFRKWIQRDAMVDVVKDSDRRSWLQLLGVENGSHS